MVAAIPKNTAIGASKRPRAFGRTSNVWHYVEAVQERTTPASKYRKQSVASVFDEDDEDEEQEHEQEQEHVDSLKDDALHPVTHGKVERNARKKHSYSSNSSSPHGRLEPMGRGSIVAALGVGVPLSPTTTQGLRNNKSLPELQLPLGANGSTTGVATGGSPGKAGGSGGGRKPPPGGFNGNEIIRRIQALGTSASAPHVGSMSMSSPLSVTGPLQGSPSTSGAFGAGAGTQPATATGTTITAAAASTSVAALPPLSDAERLRNDFNSQRGRLYFGCSIALELFNGQLMVVNSPDGAVGVQALEQMQLKSANNPSGRQRAVFTLIDLTDVRSASSIRYGDAVWLQLSGGSGESSWEQGGVLGVKVREAPQLKALALADDESIRNDMQAPLVVGHPVPVRAYLPKNRDDADAQVDEIQSRVRNKSSKMLGKWIVRSALQRKCRSNDNFVYNNDEIYLEQDWFYLGADSDAGVAVLRQLPPANGSQKELKLGEYVVERRGAWRIRLLDSSNGSAGLSLAQQQMERLLLRAKTQLKHSRKMRAGQTKQYSTGLHGGSAFVAQLRSQLVTTTRACDTQYLAQQERRLSQLPLHLSTRADTLLRSDSSSEMAYFGSGNTAAMEEADGSDATESRRPPSAASVPSPSRSPSASSHHGGGRGAGGAGGVGQDTAAAPSESVCSLCRSSTIGYNLCCQIHHVMNTLHAEIEQASAALAAAKVSAQASRSGGHATPPAATATSILPIVPDLGAPGEERSLSFSMSQRKKTSGFQRANRDTPASPTPAMATPPSTAAVPSSLGLDSNHRFLELFAKQDQQLQNLIQYKQNAVEAALLAEAQARVGLSPVATQFRDRFKHVDQLAQQHAQDSSLHINTDDTNTHDGIGGHFQKLHAEIKREETQRRDAYLRRDAPAPTRARAYLQKLQDDDTENDPDGDGELLLMQALDTTTTCPLDLPGPGMDVFGNVVGSSTVRGVERIFPNELELDKLPPVDTKQAQELYLQNKNAVVEMLDGYVDLVTTHILPNLVSAMEARNRGALVEFLDFAARASEFVCARRVQVRVAQLLHEIAVCEVGDFETFGWWFQELLREFESTTAFIRFYREKTHAKQSNAKQKRK